MKKKVLAIILACALLVGVITTASATTALQEIEVWYKDITVKLNGQVQSLKDAAGNIVEPFIYKGSNYVPVRPSLPRPPAAG